MIEDEDLYPKSKTWKKRKILFDEKKTCFYCGFEIPRKNVEGIKREDLIDNNLIFCDVFCQKKYYKGLGIKYEGASSL